MIQKAIDAHYDFLAAVLKNLMDKKSININAENPDQFDLSKETALHQSVQLGDPEITAVLLDHGANGQKKDKYGETPLLVAVKEKNLGVVQALLANAGDEVNEPNSYGNTPLDEAFYGIRNGERMDIFSALLDNSHINVNIKFGQATILASAIYQKQAQVVEALLQREDTNVNEPDGNQRTPLYLAV